MLDFEQPKCTLLQKLELMIQRERPGLVRDVVHSIHRGMSCAGCGLLA